MFKKVDLTVQEMELLKWEAMGYNNFDDAMYALYCQWAIDETLKRKNGKD